LLLFFIKDGSAMRRWLHIKIALGALLVGQLAACSSIGYYAQAIGGHVEVLRATRPIEEVVQDSATDPALRKKLERANAIRDFASRQLGLPDNGSYRSYADLGRPFVVWNVFAAPEFSLESERWCMLMVGCVAYRGFFDRSEAEKYAQELHGQGLDTYVGGVTAYSTLGYFDDPLLNTFLRSGEVELAQLIFHELSHQMAFAEGDSPFNESFATVVEREGVRRWLEHNALGDKHAAFAVQQRRKSQFLELVIAGRERLRAAYAAPVEPADKRSRKAAVLAELRQEYANLKTSWGGYAGYDAWFEQDLNNAKLASMAVYTQLVPDFEALLDEEGRDLPRFYRRVAMLARLPKGERRGVLKEVLARHRREPLQGTEVAMVTGNPQ
jgi:predicted aminopeptidase